MLSILLLEVMDKEPSILGMWVSAVILGGGGLLLCRRWPWVVLLILPVVGLGTWGLSEEIADLHVGPAILHEIGARYPMHAYASAAITVVLTLLGCALWARSRLQRHAAA